jgi:hypothetical protein
MKEGSVREFKEVPCLRFQGGLTGVKTPEGVAVREILTAGARPTQDFIQLKKRLAALLKSNSMKSVEAKIGLPFFKQPDEPLLT